ncbi:MAG: DMT family transporter [Spirochaetota bacterium]
MFNRHPSLLVLLAAAIFATSGIFIRFAGLPPASMAFFRMAVPTLLIGGYYLVRRHRIATASIGVRLVASGLNAIRLLLYLVAFANTTIANAVVMLYTWPVFAAFFSVVLLGERVDRVQKLLLALAFSGIPLLYLGKQLSFADRDVVGITAMLGSAVLHALALVLLKRAKPGNDRFESTFFQNLVGSIAFIPALWLTTALSASAAQITIAASYGLVVGLGGFTVFFIALHRMPAAVTSNLSYFEVVVGVLISWLMGEQVAWNTLVGGALISVSIIAAQVRAYRHAERDARRSG